MKYKISLLVEETTKEMAYQLVAIAVKKKHKKKIRPWFEMTAEHGHRIREDKELQNQLWINVSGQPYDY